MANGVLALITLLAHSMMMFYFIGKGKAVKDALKEHSLTGDYYQRIGAARKPVFSISCTSLSPFIAPRSRRVLHALPVERGPSPTSDGRLDGSPARPVRSTVGTKRV